MTGYRQKVKIDEAGCNGGRVSKSHDFKNRRFETGTTEQALK